MGMGYIGLPSAALLANKGYLIHGVDIDQKKVHQLNRGELYIFEPGLEEHFQMALKKCSLVASTEPAEADVFIIAVPTPFHKKKFNEVTGSPIPNIDYVLNAVKKISPFIKPGNLILLESTSPVGTTDIIANLLNEMGIDINKIFIAHSPERVLPGDIMRELTDNDRVVGGINKKSTKKAADFYRTFVKGEVMETNAKTAEMAKLTENSFRDVNIAFANELSMLCDDMDINVNELISITNRHPRVNILHPGCGVGGHCISVDPWFIVNSANGKAKLIQQARKTNNLKADWVFEKIKAHATDFENINRRKPTIACLGLAFKPDIDDLRESPALYITQRLVKENFNILAVEPNIKYHSDFKIVEYQNAITRADIIVALVAHKEFMNLELDNQFNFCNILK